MCVRCEIYPSMFYILLPATGMHDYDYEKNGFISNDDKYLDSTTERQDLCTNVTTMSDERSRSDCRRRNSTIN